MAAWIDALGEAVAAAPAFAGLSLRRATAKDEAFLFALHRDAMRGYVDATWGWDDAWQKAHFADHYEPWNHAIVVRRGAGAPDIGRVSLTYHWRRVFLRDIELVAGERNRGIGGALLAGVLQLARASHRRVDLMVLRCNPAQQLYTRLGFRVVADDGARLSMRAE